MTNRIMLRAHADENTIQFRTVSAHMKSPQRFYVTYDELDRLQRDGCIITNDIHSFARLWLDKRRDRITFEFTWLTGRGFDRVEGVEQTIHLRWSAFRAFLENCRQPDGLKDFKAISLDVSRRPRLVFDGNQANLRAAIGNAQVRHKLGKALMTKPVRISIGLPTSPSPTWTPPRRPWPSPSGSGPGWTCPTWPS